MAGMKCSVCAHPERAVVDRLLAGGSASVRSIASRFGLTKSSLLRHQRTHLLQVIERQMQRRRQREEELVAETWSTRLENTYHLAREGAERARCDDEKWGTAVGFLNIMQRTAETGMKATGELDAERGATVNIEQVIIMPRSDIDTIGQALDAPAIDVKALPTAPEEEV
jgi:hypothetical protein